jgi:hypothetical protein
MVLNNIWNKDILQHNLSFLALFIGMYEQFEDKVIENVDCFLNLGCSANDDTHCKKSEYYRQNILNRKVDENGNKNKLKATMLWFVDVGAITPEDYSLFLNIKEARNIYVHQLTKCVVNGISDKDIDMLVQLLNLFYKIDNWWINEIEIPTSGISASDDYPTEEACSMIYTIYRDMINILFLGKADDYQTYLNNLHSPTDEHSK